MSWRGVSRGGRDRCDSGTCEADWGDFVRYSQGRSLWIAKNMSVENDHPRDSQSPSATLMKGSIY